MKKKPVSPPARPTVHSASTVSRRLSAIAENSRPSSSVFRDPQDAISQMRNMTHHHKNDLWAVLMDQVADYMEANLK